MSPYSVYELAPACPERENRNTKHIEIQRLHVRPQQVLQEPFPLHHCCTPSSTVGTTLSKVNILMVLRPALQAAGFEDQLCMQPHTYAHHGEFKYGTMGYSELHVMEQIHEQIEDIPGLVIPHFSRFAEETPSATGRCLTSSIWCETCAC